MSNISSLVKYKQALLLKKDLEEMLPILRHSISQLNRYKDRYDVVRKCISSLEDTKAIIEIHDNNLKKVIANKGLLTDNKNDE